MKQGTVEQVQVLTSSSLQRESWFISSSYKNWTKVYFKLDHYSSLSSPVSPVFSLSVHHPFCKLSNLYSENKTEIWNRAGGGTHIYILHIKCWDIWYAKYKYTVNKRQVLGCQKRYNFTGTSSLGLQQKMLKHTFGLM